MRVVQVDEFILQAAYEFLRSTTLRRWRATGKGPPCYKLEGQWGYIEDEVIEWVRAHRITFSVRDEHFEREAARVNL